MDGDIKTSEKLQKCTVWLVCGCMYIAQNTAIDLVPKFAIMLFFLTAVCFVFVVFRIVCVYVTFLLFYRPTKKKRHCHLVTFVLHLSYDFIPSFYIPQIFYGYQTCSYYFSDHQRGFVTSHKGVIVGKSDFNFLQNEVILEVHQN